MKSLSQDCVCEILSALRRQTVPTDVTEIAQLLAFGTTQSCASESSNTTTYLAAELKSSGRLTLLVRHGISCDILDGKWNLPIHIAVAGSTLDISETVSCCDILLEQGNSIILQNADGKSALHVAAQNWRGKPSKYCLNAWSKTVSIT